jgi:hypothetical protein
MKQLTVVGIALALSSVFLCGTGARVEAQQQQQLCVWNEDAQNALQECIEGASECTSCCLHEHLPLNWKRCTNDGESKKKGVTKKYYSAITRTCVWPNPCSSGTSGNCTHSENHCTVEDCP